MGPLRCYQCNKLGRDCRVPKSKSQGEKNLPPASTKQVSATATDNDPMSYLQSDSEGDSINLIRVADQGSKPHRVKVMVQGVMVL